ncbi:hypothetical protein V493_07756, partial [Pseudogymnoascus sp. VKM F-4281 (FW-2241)]
MHIQTGLLHPLLLALLATSAAAQGEQKCYGINGQPHSSDIQPCAADLPAGSHVACCNTTKSPPDICVGGGLCYNQGGKHVMDMLVAYGCTDPTGEDPACQKSCDNKGSLKYYLHACQDANWCCSDDRSPCCSLTRFKLNPLEIIPVVKPVTHTTGGDSTPTGTAAVVTTTAQVDAAGQTVGVCGADAGAAGECPKDN